MTTTTLVQVEFRARGDTVGLNVNTWDHALNANFSQEVNVPFRVRFTIAETTGGHANNIAYSLQYNLAGAGFVAIGDTEAVHSNLSSQFANADPTTQVISTGSFVAGAGYEQTTTSNITLSNQRTEIEWCLGIDGAQVTNGQTFTLRVVQAAGVVLQTYTQTPTITVVEAAGVDFTGEPATGSLTLTGQTPTWSATADITAEPSTAAVTTTGFAPTVTAEHSFTAVPDVGAATVTGLAPTWSGVQPDFTAEPGVAAVTIIGLAPTVAADVAVTPSLATLTITGLAPIVSTGLTERLTPNAVIAGGTNLQDTLTNSPPTRLADIDEETGSDDTEWWTAVDPEADIDVHLGFPDGIGSPVEAVNLVGTQMVRVRIRGTSLPSRPARLDLYENGAPAPGSPTITVVEDVTSISGQVVEITFQPSDLADPTGAGVEIRIRATAV